MNVKQNETITYHVAQIIRITFKRFNQFLDWGAAHIQAFIDMYQHNKMLKYKQKSQAYFSKRK